MNDTGEPTQQLPLKCERCGRQDETVRLVVLPYVVSLIVITFRREFSGCWCRLHRNQMWLVASLLTLILGWIGIPFGLIFAPVALVQLARGGLFDRNANGVLLRSIGQLKEQQGDPVRAVRCYEASLIFAEDPETVARLGYLYRTRSTDQLHPLSVTAAILLFPILPLFSAGMGIFVGFADFLVQSMGSYLPIELPIYVIILLKAPFLTLVYTSVVLISAGLKFAIQMSRSGSKSFLAVVSTLSAVTFVNGIVSGEAYGIYLAYFLGGLAETMPESLRTILAILTRAGPYIFNPWGLTTNMEGTVLFGALLILALALAMLVLIPGTRELAAQQQRIGRLRMQDDPQSLVRTGLGWAAIVGVVALAALLYVATPQRTSVDTLEAFDHINRGWGHINAGEHQEAISAFALAAELRPNSLPNNIGSGYAHYYLGNLDTAKHYFQLVLSIEPKSLDGHAGLGWVYLQEGSTELAKQEFRQVVRLDPQYLDGRLGLGWVSLEEFDPENGRREFEMALDVAPEHAEAHYGLGSAYLMLYDYENALTSLNTARRLNPDYIDAGFLSGLAYYSQGKFLEAKDAFQAVLNAQPDHYSALVWLAQVHVVDYEYDQALNYFDRAIGLDPKGFDAHFGKASLLSQMAEFEKSVAHLQASNIDLNSAGPLMARNYYSMGMDAEAASWLEKSLSAAPDLGKLEQADLYSQIAVLEAQLGHYGVALDYMELAVSVYPLGAESYQFLSEIHTGLGQFPEAQAAIQNAERIGHSRLSMHFARAGLLMEQGLLHDARNEIDAAVALDPESSRAHAVKSFIVYQMGEYALAAQEAQEAVRLNPLNSEAHMHLAFALRAMGGTDSASLAAQEAVRLNPLNDLAHYILGVCYQAMRMNSLAKAEYSEYLERYVERSYTEEYKAHAEEFILINQDLSE